MAKGHRKRFMGIINTIVSGLSDLEVFKKRFGETNKDEKEKSY